MSNNDTTREPEKKPAAEPEASESRTTVGKETRNDPAQKATDAPAPEEKETEAAETVTDGEDRLPKENNLIKLPVRRDPDAEKQRRSRRRRLILLPVAALVIVLALVVLLFPELVNFDAVKRYFHYLGKRDSEGYGSISFDADGTNDYGTLGDVFALGADGGLYLFDFNGEQKLVIEGTTSDPRVLCSDDRVLCYSMSGSYFALADLNGNRLIDTTLSGTILDVDLSRDGYIAYNQSGSEEKTVTTVLNRDGAAIYRYRSSSQYLNLCAVSSNGQALAVAGLSENNSAFSSNVVFLKTNQELVAGSEEAEKSVKRLDLGNRLVYDLSFTAADRVCILTEDALVFASTAGEQLKEYPYEDGILTACSFGGKGFVVLLLRDSMGDGYTLLSFDPNGKLLGSDSFHQTFHSLDARGSYIALLSDGGLTVYRKNLQQYAQQTDVGSATQVCMRDDGTALLISGDKAEMYYP